MTILILGYIAVSLLLGPLVWWRFTGIIEYGGRPADWPPLNAFADEERAEQVLCAFAGAFFWPVVLLLGLGWWLLSLVMTGLSALLRRSW